MVKNDLAVRVRRAAVHDMPHSDAELLSLFVELKGNISQQEAAEFLGMKQSAVSQVLTGKHKLSGIGRRFLLHLLEEITPTTRPAKLTSERKGETLC